MSLTLHWRPLRGTDTEALPDQLKTILVKAFPFEKPEHGSLEPRESRLFDISFLPYLTGLRDAGIDGAQALIDAIDRNEKVELLIF